MILIAKKKETGPKDADQPTARQKNPGRSAGLFHLFNNGATSGFPCLLNAASAIMVTSA
jgi:hypothetical protein